MDSPATDARITSVKLGPVLVGNMRQYLAFRDEREAGLIQDSLNTKLRDAALPPHLNRVDANLRGPLTLTLDQTTEEFSFNLKDQQDKEETAFIKTSDIKMLLGSYLNARKAYIQKPLPVGDDRLREELAGHDAHGHGAVAIRDELHNKGISVTRRMGEQLFSLLAFAYHVCRNPILPPISRCG